MKLIKINPANGHVAVYDEAPGEGDPADIHAPRHRPLLDPVNWLDNLHWHSAFNLLELISDTEVIVSHPAVAAATAAGGETDTSVAFSYNGGVINWGVLTHDIGDYAPLVMVTADDDALSSTYLIQANAGGAQRYVSAYSTTTQIFIREVAVQGNLALAALDQTYRILVFRNPRDPEGNLAAQYDASNDRLRLAFDRFDTQRRYMQVRPGGSPFGLATGPTIDLNNGAPLFHSPSGSYSVPIPYTLKQAIRVTSQPAVYGDSMGWGGSFSPSPIIQLQVP